MAVEIPAGKSPLYLTENLLGGQLPHVLWRWPVGLLSQEINKNKNLNNVMCPLLLKVLQNIVFNVTNHVRLAQYLVYTTHVVSLTLFVILCIKNYGRL